MDPLIALIIWVIVICAFVWLGFYICDKAGFPPPVRWIFGAICLLILIVFMLSKTGLYTPGAHPLGLR